MTNLQKFIVGVGIVVALLFSFSVYKSSPTTSVGGVYNEVTQYFRSGLKAGSLNQFIVSATGVVGSTTTGLYRYNPVITPTTDTTLTVDQSGATVNMGTAGLDLTLPAPTAANGVHYKFVVSAAFATTDMTIVAGTADTIEGSLIVAGAVVTCDAADIITIAAANEDIGDFIDIYSNGTKWMVGANQAMTASNHACSG